MTRIRDSQEAIAYARQVALHRGWVVNTDAPFISPILVGLAQVSARLGLPYCPCRDADGLESDRDIVCPCAYAASDINDYGQCYCGLFLAPDKSPSSLASIPERRAD